ncbi:MAG: GNAT family N-acetyltransferase [Kiloniellales bacterium]|nr:GNAT family N-acetyltransferase [Kiloniellales bacterium]
METSSPEFRIRPAVRADAAAVAVLGNKLNLQHGLPENFTEASILRDGFDGTQRFSLLVAEHRARVVGYALYHPQYNSDKPGWGLWLVDLFVEPELRGRGLGRRLLAAVAAEAVATGAVSLWWGVVSANRNARDFYAALGARDEDARILELDGTALAALAGQAEPEG